MGYLHIENLYRPAAQRILLFKEVFSLEKIHGTSSHISWKDGALKFFSGGVSHQLFVKLFDEEDLISRFKEIGHDEVVIYGEAYGGKCQKMAHTYGKELRFVAFDVKIGETWLNVENAADVVSKLALEFVYYEKVSTDIEELDRQRDAPSVQAIRNGIEGEHMREGVVLRPLEEFVDSSGNRLIVKHKRAEFSERVNTPKVTPDKLEMLLEAEAIALEWVTDMRMNHVLDKLGNPQDMTATGAVISAMVEDVCREAEGEIIDSREARKAISSAAAKMFKKRVVNSLNK